VLKARTIFCVSGRRSAGPAAAFAVAAGLALVACTPDPSGEATLKDQPRASVVDKKLVSRPKVNDDPKQLMGLDQDALTGLLGPPRFVRRDAGAELWRYRNPACILDLFLYGRDGKDAGGATVRYFEARTASKAHTTARACLGALLVQRLERG